MCIPFHTLLFIQSNLFFQQKKICVAHGEGWGNFFFGGVWGPGGGGGGLEDDSSFDYCATMHFELADFAFPDKITEMLCYF